MILGEKREWVICIRREPESCDALQPATDAPWVVSEPVGTPPTVPPVTPPSIPALQPLGSLPVQPLTTPGPKLN